jgi:uncharacterized protein YndB with AHSA1/START domain
MSQPVRWPDHQGESFTLTVEHSMAAAPAAIYRAWTQQFDRWFAEPGSVLMTGEVNAPYFFETVHRFEGEKPDLRHAHYGRFLRLDPDRLVEMTWMTGRLGTRGAETVVRVEITPEGAGAHVKLTHSGFYDIAARDQHADGWREVLPRQDAALAAPYASTGSAA